MTATIRPVGGPVTPAAAAGLPGPAGRVRPGAARTTGRSRRSAERRRRPPSTPRTIRRLRAGLLILTVLAVIGCALEFGLTRAAADTVATHTAPAVLDLTAARGALIDANAAAVTSFASGAGTLAGPGQRYQDDLALAGQGLAKAAGNNQAGPDGATTIQLAETLLASYTAAVEQADAYYRRDGTGSLLATTNLAQASELLHSGDGLLVRLDQLRTDQQRALDRQRRPGPSGLLELGWLLPCALLLVVLVATQVLLARRFHRLVNVAMLAATLLLAALAATTATGIVARHRLADASTSLTGVVAGADGAQARVDAAGRREVADLLATRCAGQCDDTVAALRAALPADPGPAVAGSEAQVTVPATSVQAVTAAARGAVFDGMLQIAIAVWALGIAALVVLGLQPRIDEYKGVAS